jgi:EthD domain
MSRCSNLSSVVCSPNHISDTTFSDPTSVDRTAASATNADHSATVLVGAQAGFDYDAFAELVFQDDAAFQAFFACVGQAEAAEKIAKDATGLFRCTDVGQSSCSCDSWFQTTGVSVLT